MTLPHPWNDLPVIKANDQLHLHRHFAAQTFDDSNDVGILSARRHEIDQAHRAAFRFNFCLQDERLVSISSSCLLDLLLRKKSPVAIFFLTEERSKARRRIEPREAKPINAAVAAHERAGLRITQERVIFDLRSARRHGSFAMDSDCASFAIPSSVKRNTAHSSIGFAPSER